MQDLIKVAVMNLEQQQIEPLFSEDEFFEKEENIDGAYYKVNEMIADLDPGELDLDVYDFNAIEYISDNETVEEYVRDILAYLNVPEDEIDNYLCEVLLKDSFLDIEVYDFSVNLTVDVEKLAEYLITVEINY